MRRIACFCLSIELLDKMYMVSPVWIASIWMAFVDPRVVTSILYSHSAYTCIRECRKDIFPIGDVVLFPMTALSN